jgi:hypothetical protein
MNTAVQLRPIAAVDLPRCDLLHGSPREILPGDLGPVALFAAGEIVAYRLRSRRRTSLFVFRTLDVDDRLAAAVAGVRPHVHLLLELHSAGRVRLTRALFASLIRSNRDPSGLPDAFYVRVGVALAGRLPVQKILLSLLSQQPTPTMDVLAVIRSCSLHYDDALVRGDVDNAHDSPVCTSELYPDTVSAASAPSTLDAAVVHLRKRTAHGGQPPLGLMQGPIAWASRRRGPQGASASAVQSPGTREYSGTRRGRGGKP